MSDEKRTFSRVDVRLKGYARAMNSLDSPPLFTSGAVVEKRNFDQLFRSSKLPEDLATFLSEMDRKLDSILGILSKDQIKSDFPLDIEIREISAAGVKFRSKIPLSVDDTLEMVINLSQIPLTMASSKGRIRGFDKETELYRFEFIDIRGADLEAIVQFVFQKQREEIRNSKL
ncbi:PilZ domain-containing protein [Pseudodesulfovibrio cashew]|uniref:PilZ domain-containing protein n=1 Tax=Pseudodesulfovibrio cashew TaxID=2678688 RepID=A0A6I6JJM5_9BACT|nr:PilZ domain-containing protein [Pseudodesulfovibrio cashew]QGY41230.1 PilZ domain-containing protein [Pseudodesulfovibrio cashew]